MNSNRLIAIAIGAVVALLLIVNSFFIVNEREQAIVLRFGEIQAVHTEPGLHFKAPFSFAGFDTVQIIEDRLLLAELDDIRVQTSGGRFYIVNAFITYRIENPIRFRQAASGDLTIAENNLETRFEDAVRGVYGRRGFEAALSDARAEMMRDVTARLRPDAESLGLSIEDVRIRRTDLTPEVSEQTFQRMRSEREAEAARLRARGNERAQGIRARAEREVVEIESDATREAEIVRGRGEGERARIFADSVGRDPGFYEFYRSLEAYRRALEDGGTRMVLSPDTEFFRFFQEAGVSALPTPTPTAISTDATDGLSPTGDENVTDAPVLDEDASADAVTPSETIVIEESAVTETPEPATNDAAPIVVPDEDASVTDETSSAIANESAPAVEIVPVEPIIVDPAAPQPEAQQ